MYTHCVKIKHFCSFIVWQIISCTVLIIVKIVSSFGVDNQKYYFQNIHAVSSERFDILFVFTMYFFKYKIRLSCACKHVFKISSLHILHWLVFVKMNFVMHHSKVVNCSAREISFNHIFFILFDFGLKNKKNVYRSLNAFGRKCLFWLCLCFGFQFWQFFQINFLSFLFLFYL